MNEAMYISSDRKDELLNFVETLMALYKEGVLGGERMPEDSNPCLAKESEDNYLFFTLPMALNYQRNSYKLWEAAKNTYRDESTIDVFRPDRAANMGLEELRKKLGMYKVALQPNKHTQTWMQLCRTFSENYNGSVKRMFVENGYSVKQIKNHMAGDKKSFPYLSGPKITNYWLYVMEQYTDTKFPDRQNITVAPDTHILQASVKIGLISLKDIDNPNIREITSDKWESVLTGSSWYPIDIHTPLWLWSRSGFKIKVGMYGGESSKSRIQFLF